MLPLKKNPLLLALLLFTMDFTYRFAIAFLNLSKSLSYLHIIFGLGIPVFFGFLYSLIFKEKIYDVSKKIAGYFCLFSILLALVGIIMGHFGIKIPGFGTPPVLDITTTIGIILASIPIYLLGLGLAFVLELISLELGSWLYFYFKTKFKS